MPSAHSRADAHRRRLARLRRGLDYAEDISEYNRIAAEIRQLRAVLIRAV
jgi:hypothetical protein